MHLLVPAILLGMTWRYELHSDAQRRPPSTQPRKPGWAGGSKRTAVVHSDDRWIAVLSEQSQKDPLHGLPSLIGQYSNAQHIATEQIPHRQWFYPTTILSTKPAFEIHGPDMIAASSYSQGSQSFLWAQSSTSADAPA
jgi:hypothetical protein